MCSFRIDLYLHSTWNLPLFTMTLHLVHSSNVYILLLLLLLHLKELRTDNLYSSGQIGDQIVPQSIDLIGLKPSTQSQLDPNYNTACLTRNKLIRWRCQLQQSEHDDRPACLPTQRGCWCAIILICGIVDWSQWRIAWWTWQEDNSASLDKALTGWLVPTMTAQSEIVHVK